MATYRVVKYGVTRLVVLTPNWALKVPQPTYFLRGWLANQSEWKQRHRSGIEPPRGTFFHLLCWYRRAIEIGAWEPEEAGDYGHTDWGDELKGSSWGRFPEGWRLIDYDRAWHPAFRSRVGRIYYWNQSRLGRKWSRLPAAPPTTMPPT